jgi:predicted amidohydrolase YtcJ
MSPCRTLDEAVRVVSVKAHELSAQDPHAWLWGGGWQQLWFEGGVPMASILDAVGFKGPICLRDQSCHELWVNTRALEVTAGGRGLF